MSPYLLVHRQELVFPLKLKFPVLKFMSGYGKYSERVPINLMNLLEMDEKWIANLENMVKHQVFLKRWFEKRDTINSFRISNLVLLWDKAKENSASHTKFQYL